MPCEISINNGEKKLTAEPGQRLLAALGAHGIVLPSACGGNGRCGMCRVRVLGGSAGPVTELEEKKLTPDQLGNKWRLACQTELTGDIVIELPGQLIGSEQLTCVVEQIETLTYDIKGVRLRLPEGKRVKFKAGQYMQISAPPYGTLKKGAYRAYSLACSPAQSTAGGYIDFCIRKVPNGMVTTWVHEHLQVGMPVTVTGPYGEFYLRESEREIILIAGGSGLSPVQSVLYDMADRGISNRKASFYFGACTFKDMYYTERFRQFEREHPWFRYVPAFSNEPEVGSDCEKGLITEVVDRAYTDFSNHEAYLCGSPGMIGACKKVLMEKGMPESLIFYDKFA